MFGEEFPAPSLKLPSIPTSVFFPIFSFFFFFPSVIRPTTAGLLIEQLSDASFGAPNVGPAVLPKTRMLFTPPLAKDGFSWGWAPQPLWS